MRGLRRKLRQYNKPRHRAIPAPEPISGVERLRFEAMYESSNKRELMLVDGGMCRYHLRQDGQVTIYEIISTRPGAGSRILRRLERVPGVSSIFAKCPVNLGANDWYAKRGFYLMCQETTRTGRELNHWRKPVNHPKIDGVTLIYCAGGNRRYAEIAIDAGLEYGAQLPDTVYYQPYFVDQDWRNPNRDTYIDAVAKHKPYMATVLDWERLEQFDEVMSWAEAIAPHVTEIVIIPKVPGEVHRIPMNVCGKHIRLGYSVPTKFAGTTVPLSEFVGWPVHLLGGSPHQQLALAETLDVRSADGNFIQGMAQRCQWWSPGYRGKNRFWPTLAESDGGWQGRDANYEAFRRSCHARVQAWRNLNAARQVQSNGQLPLLAAFR